MSTNNQTTDKDTNVPYKLPTDIESRFDTGFCFDDMDTPDLRVVKSLRTNRNQTAGVKNFIATEQVTLLESMASEIEKMKHSKKNIESGSAKTVRGVNYVLYDEALDDVIVKVQAKLQEYKQL